MKPTFYPWFVTLACAALAGACNAPAPAPASSERSADGAVDEWHDGARLEAMNANASCGSSNRDGFNGNCHDLEVKPLIAATALEELFAAPCPAVELHRGGADAQLHETKDCDRCHSEAPDYEAQHPRPNRLSYAGAKPRSAARDGPLRRLQELF